nr:hypothetical protein BaRGS_000597 [Batillaria attramentaria]
MRRCRRRFLRRKNFKIEVPMNFYSFEQLEQTFKPRKRRAGAVDAGCGNGPSGSKLEGKALAHRDQTSPEHTGLETVFNNDTGEEQTYNFKFEKIRKATISVSYQKGYSIGGKANFSLGLPKVLSDGSAGVELDMHVQVSKTTGETFEESLTTSATSEIKVSGYSHYTASVVMEERSLVADFVLDIIMSMPAKRAPVYIKDKKTGEQVFVYNLNSLLDLFEDNPDVTRVKDEEGKVRADAVQFRIEGKVDGMQLSSHTINLSGRKIPGRELNSSGSPDAAQASDGARTSDAC